MHWSPTRSDSCSACHDITPDVFTVVFQNNHAIKHVLVFGPLTPTPDLYQPFGWLFVVTPLSLKQTSIGQMVLVRRAPARMADISRFPCIRGTRGTEYLVGYMSFLTALLFVYVALITQALSPFVSPLELASSCYQLRVKCLSCVAESQALL